MANGILNVSICTEQDEQTLEAGAFQTNVVLSFFGILDCFWCSCLLQVFMASTMGLVKQLLFDDRLLGTDAFSEQAGFCKDDCFADSSV